MFYRIESSHVSGTGGISRKAGVALAFWLFPALVFPGGQGQGQNLEQKSREFLRLSAHIMLPQEETVFRKLETARDREIFIESFWKQRDPTPGTPQNEYKEEQIRRFEYANKFFSRGTSREGWMTDRGKIYVILGEPASKHDFSGKRGIYPCEVWYYYGDKAKGLPTHFGFVFFKRRGVGELKLYDPVSDGISSLLMNAESMANDNFFTLYQQLAQLVPELAPVALSIIPGEIPSNYMPSPQTAILMSEIIESPKRDVNPKYAKHFLDFKGMVSTEYMTNYIESTAHVDVLRDPLTGLDVLSFSIAPKTLSFDYFPAQDKYFCNYQLNVSFRKDKDVIFQYNRDFPIYFSPDEAERVKANGISIEDAFPVVEGRYHFIALLQNSVGKEFTTFEQDISIPDREGQPRIQGPVVGYRLVNYPPDAFMPYKFLDKKLWVDPSLTFSVKDEISVFFSLSNIDEKLWKEGQVSVTVRRLKTGTPVPESRSFPLKDKPFNGTLTWTYTLPAEERIPDYQELSVTLKDGGGAILDDQKAQFVVSADDGIPHPIAQAKMISMANKAPLYHMLAGQYEKIGRVAQAEDLYQRGYALSPDSTRGLIDYARFLFKVKKFERSLALIEKIKDDPNLKFDYVLTKGLAYMEMGRYGEALDQLQEGARIYDSHVVLLNALGTCYFQTRQKEKALGALRASLRLNPEQEEIRKLIGEIEKSLR